MFAILLAAAVIPGFTLNTSTPRADYYVMSGTKLKVKPGACDHELEKIERELGVRVPRFQYLRVQDPSDVSRHSRSHRWAGGTAEPDPPRIIAQDTCSTHELVHLATFQIGRGDPIIEEGVATMLAGDYNWLDRHNTRNAVRHRFKKQVRYGDLRAAFLSEANSADRFWYIVSDAWIRHLRSHHGMPLLIKYLRLQGTGVDAYKAFPQVYGADLDETFNDWLY